DLRRLMRMMAWMLTPCCWASIAIVVPGPTTITRVFVAAAAAVGAVAVTFTGRGRTLATSVAGVTTGRLLATTPSLVAPPRLASPAIAGPDADAALDFAA